MKILVTITGVWFLLVTSTSCGANSERSHDVKTHTSDEQRCLSLPACTAKLNQIATSKKYVHSKFLAEDMRRLGEPAWKVIVDLSASDDERVRDLAGSVMGQWFPLSEEKIPEIVAALRREPGGWPARALMRIPSEEATRALIDDVARIGGGNQSSFALGARLPEAFPLVFERMEEVDSIKLASGLSEVLSRPAEPENLARRQDIVKWLMAAASNQGNAPAYRRQATGFLLDMGPLKSVDLSPLRRNLESPDRSLVQLTRILLSQQGDPAALPYIQEECRQASKAGDANDSTFVSPRASCLNHLARAGAAAAGSVPLLEEWLEKATLDTSNQILATLGYLGDRSVVPLLESKLDSNDDREVTASLESLWRLRSKESLPRIHQVASEHWYSTVRTYASLVVTALETGDGTAVEAALDRAFRNDELASKHVWGLSMANEKRRKDCIAWQVDDNLIEYEEYLRTDAALLRKYQHSVDGLSQVAETSNGVFLGINKGEFGGGLVYQDRIGKKSDLSPENVVALLPRSDGSVLALVGLAHLMDRGGSILEIATDQSVPRVVASRRLPSAPNAVYRVKQGWLVNLASNEAVLLKVDLSLSEVGCYREFK